MSRARALHRTVFASIVPMTQALLIVDMQRALCTGEEAAFGIDDVLQRINAVAGQARAAGVPVVLVQHEDDGPLVQGSEGWQLADGLTVDASDLRVRKTRPDSFHGTALQALLQERGVEQLVVCGLQSDFCIDASVRCAIALGYPVNNRSLASMAGTGLPIEVKPAAEVSLR